MANHLFSYGVLQFPEVLEALLGDALIGENAMVRGFHRRDLHYSGLNPCSVAVPEQLHSISGVLFRNVPDSLWTLLDLFELIPEGIYERIEVPVECASGEILTGQLYVTGPNLTAGSIGGTFDEKAFLETDFQDLLDSVIPQFLESLKKTA